MSQAKTDMQEHWEKFAEDDPMFYIATWNKDWSVDDFYASGKETVDRMMDWIGPDTGRDRMLEIGCGLGRTSVHFADHFARVDAIDISQNMINAAKKAKQIENLHFAASSGKDLSEFEDGIFDLVYCYIVFQHIPHESVQNTYLQEIGRVLKKGGKATLQYDCRPEGALVKLYKSLPDFMLPRNHRRFIRRYRRDPARLKEMMSQAGLRVIDEKGVRTEEHFFLLEK